MQATAGHPRGLTTLFFTEMWERFSYYGMRALLVLFMVDQTRGGMGLDDKTATAIYGLYTAGVYLAALPGGWVADRICGAQRAVWLGGCIIALGHFTLAIPSSQAFFLGLTLVVIGTGLLKPNVSALVAELYPEGGARRDAGFTIFYMGINLGAAIGPLVCSGLGESARFGWHAGFAAAGVGMIFGLVQFRLTASLLGGAGLERANRDPLTSRARATLLTCSVLSLAIVALSLAGVIRWKPILIAEYATVAIVSVALIYFGGLFVFGRLTAEERPRVGVILILFLTSALFWAGFEQVGSSFNLFAERHTDRTLGGMTIPAGWFQSLGPIFIIGLAPVVAVAWVRLAARNREPSLAAKFGIALIFLAAGFAVMSAAAVVVSKGGQAAPTWLITTFLLHTLGELCLSPVGLSSVTKLSPKRLVGQMMGVWFLATSLGSLIAGRLAGQASEEISRMPAEFMRMFWLPAVAGVVLLLLSRPIAHWSRGVR